jgi:membrane-bound serine protease (ClpP class)
MRGNDDKFFSTTLPGQLVLSVLGLLLLASPAAAQEAAAAKELPTAQVLKLQLPITTNVKAAFVNALSRYTSRLPADANLPVLVIEFTTKDGEVGRGSNFFDCYAIAELLTSKELSKVKTVAYIPKTVKGHAVLVALACQVIIMAPNAELGEAGIDDDAATIKKRVDEYIEIAKTRQSIPAPVAQAMLDPTVKVVQVETADGKSFVLASEFEELRKTQNVIKDTLLAPQPLLISGTDGRQKLGVISFLAPDRRALEQALQVTLKENARAFGEWKAFEIRLDQSLNRQMLAEREQKLSQAYNDGEYNFALITIDSDGGASDASISFVQKLINLDPSRMTTVAWVERKALGDAAWIALACDQLVMAPDAMLGGDGSDAIDKDQRNAFASQFQTFLSDSKKRPWSLGTAVIGQEKPTFLYKNTQSNQLAIFSDAEHQSQPDPAAWKQLQKISEAGQRLSFTGRRAEEWGVPELLADNLHQLKAHYGLENDPTLLEPSWADFLLRALRSENVGLFLLLIGGAAVIAELQTPGFGLGGMVAFICFLLFFWAKFLDGTSGWLEVMLFVFGLIFLCLEIFVFPGFGILGFGGGLMMITAIILASQTFIIPSNPYQLGQLRNSLVTIALSGVGIVAAAIAIRRFLPRAPGFNRMMLEPPTDQEREYISRSESLADFKHLVGREGHTTTRLTPTGKALIDDQVIDVIAPGEYLDANTPIRVSEVRGSRVIVKRVS